jgi:hypothetical protein
MGVVASWDGSARRIYLAQGVTSFHPIDDIYREYRVARRTDEELRKYEPFMVAPDIISKGGGKYTPRFLVLLDGCKIVRYDDDGVIDVTGEVITDDETDPFDFTSLMGHGVIRYAPAEAELITIPGGGISEEQMNTLIGQIWASS